MKNGDPNGAKIWDWEFDGPVLYERKEIIV